MHEFQIRYDHLQEKLLEHGFTLSERKFELVATETDGELEYVFYTLKEVNGFLLGLAYKNHNEI